MNGSMIMESFYFILYSHSYGCLIGLYLTVDQCEMLSQFLIILKYWYWIDSRFEEWDFSCCLESRLILLYGFFNCWKGYMEWNVICIDCCEKAFLLSQHWILWSAVLNDVRIIIELITICWLSLEWCEDKNVLLKRVSERNKTRTVISSGKRPNPSDLGS